MLTKQIYKISTSKNLLTKYNIEYNKHDIKDLVCATHIARLLDAKYTLTKVQQDRLKEIVDCLIQPSRYWNTGNDQDVLPAILLERELNCNFGITTENRIFITKEYENNDTARIRRASKKEYRRY